jgi:type III secretory pathway lipoprotein EscJ
VSPSPRLPAVVATGDRRASLEALRDHLAASLLEVDVRYKAPLAKQLADVMREIDGLRDAKVVSPLDELRTKRAARSSAS